MAKNKIIINSDTLEVRAGQPNNTIGDGNTVYGRAISYEVESDNLQFVEIIHRGAVDDELLQNSDVYARVNHSDDYIVARWNRGNGSLHLENREDGLYYSFDIPNTEKGRELAEHIRRGEITSSSFSFMVNADGERWSKRNGKVYHEVDKIAYLHDIAPVYLPAYNASSCSLRVGEAFAEIENSNENMDKENKEKKSVKVTTTETVTKVTEEVTEIEEKEKENVNTDNDIVADSIDNVVDNGDNETRSAQIEEDNSDENKDGQDDNENGENSNENDSEEMNEAEEKTNEEENEASTEDEEKDNEDNKLNKRNSTIMSKKKYSLVDAINSVVANKPLNDVAEAVNRSGANALMNSGVGYTGQITLPLSNRDAISVETEGELVPVDVWDIFPAIYNKSVLADAGVRFLDGLTGDVVLPSGNAATVYWEGENDEAGDASITFGSAKLQPKRLCATCLISKKLLIQTSDAVENYVRQTIVDALRAKIEATVLSADAGTTEKPAGIRYNKTAEEITDFASLVDAEAAIDGKEDYNEKVYILSPKMKAALRSMTKGQGNGNVFENGEVDGVRALTTASLGSDAVGIYGDFSNIVLGTFGAIDIVVEQEPKYGAIRLTINAYVDAATVRDNFVVEKIGE